MIKIRGARQHNLKNIDIDLPHHKLIVITGLSGSGKSSLAFDTLYAEGQRRYVESLSTHTRQFLERMEKPDADLIEGLCPAIAIEQKTAGHNPRSTVGTLTEIYDYLRLLYTRIGTAHCTRCGQAITSQSIDQMVDTLMGYSDGTRLMILSPLISNSQGNTDRTINHLKRQGFARARINGTVMDIDAIGPLAADDTLKIEVVVDRLVIKTGIRNRLADSLELALSLSNGKILANLSCPLQDDQLMVFSEKAVCPTCNISYPEFTPASFSFNSPHGACPECGGLGSRRDIDPELLVPNPELSLREGAMAIWAKRDSLNFIEFLEALARMHAADIYTPFKQLPEPMKQAIFFGTGERPVHFSIVHASNRHDHSTSFEGVIPQLQRRYQETDSTKAREEIEAYMTLRPCPACQGARLRPESQTVQIQGMAIHQITALSITQSLAFFRSLTCQGQQARIASVIVQALIQRLEFLYDVGLSYLSLDRSANTLSGGESQRIRLATQIGAKLTGVLYVLDEPSIGLHQRDNQKLLDLLKKMRDLGNTVLVVEHDLETIQTADHVVDMGPGAGVLGGQILYSGPPQGLPMVASSLTGQYLSGQLRIALPLQRRVGHGTAIAITGATHHNLKEISATFPLGCLICVTGVSGSGKSSLVIETLYGAVSQLLNRGRIRAGHYKEIDGLQHIDKVINIDQSAIGSTPRSNPATYTGMFTYIRELFSKTPEARMHGYPSGRFSFNAKGGRCEACGGEGNQKIEMHFLPDIYVTCDICHGKRYNRETLEVLYKGKNIAQVLDMTVDQAFEFFQPVGIIRDKLKTMVEVGLGYIQVGQPATTLSGGESQRVKLARELSKRGTGRTLYILDEPTSGLHMDDIHRLLLVLDRLVAYGNTVIVIEHNLEVIKMADHIIDLGPEGGDAGGWILGSGTPEEIAILPHSYTGLYLKPILGIGQ